MVEHEGFTDQIGQDRRGTLRLRVRQGVAQQICIVRIVAVPCAAKGDALGLGQGQQIGVVAPLRQRYAGGQMAQQLR